MTIIDPDLPVIETRDLTKVYNKKAAVQSLNLKVPRHSIFGFLGANGAGKSTTMKMSIGAVRPTRGGGQILGLDLVKDSVKIRQKIGYLAQDIHFYPDLTPRETLRFCAGFFPAKPHLEGRIKDCLALVGLQELMDRTVGGFSGGEKQRLGIAQAFLHEPEIIILDEPAANLDPMGRYNVLQIMKQLQEHTTIFFSTHILDDVQKICDRVAILNKGELVIQGTLGEITAGREGAIYTLTTRGDTGTIQNILAQQSWITSISTQVKDSQIAWEIGVTDTAKAEGELLRLILNDPQVIVSQFGRKLYELEDIFMKLLTPDS